MTARISDKEYRRLLVRCPRLSTDLSTNGAPGGALPGIGQSSKYGNEPTSVDGYRFDSRAEATYYGELKLRERAGEITSLVADKAALRFPLIVNGETVCVYEADFTYTDARTGQRIVADVKGHKTAEYRLKAKLFRAVYGFAITEISLRGSKK